jgi:hypothetical protein
MHFGFFAVVAAWTGFAPSIHAQEYCSLAVNIVDMQGRAVEAKVAVQESDGRTVEKTANFGLVQFCDLGIEPVTISVGHPGCNQAVVRNVGLRWGTTIKVKIIYDREPCLVDEPPVAACQMLFRFADAEQRWLKGVALKLQSPEDKIFNADEYGRIHMRVAAFKEVVGIATTPGYEPAEIRIRCTSENEHLERRMTLKKLAPK